MKTCKINDFKEFESFSNQILEQSVSQFNQFLQNQQQILRAEKFQLEEMIFKTSIEFGRRLTQCVYNIEEPDEVKNQMLEAGYRLTRKRLKLFMTRFGQVEVERNYYYNPDIKKCAAPADSQLPLVTDYFSLSAAMLVLPVLLSLPIQQALKIIESVSGLSFVSSTIQNLAQFVGEDFEDKKDELLSEPPESWEPLEPDEDLVVEIDGAMYHERSQGWKEGKLGCVVRMKVNDESATGWEETSRYYFGSAKTLGDFECEFERTLTRLGYENAEEMLWLGDGAPWIRRLYESYMGDEDLLILDYYHAVQHLNSLADAYFGEHSSEAKKIFVDQQKDRLFDSPEIFIAGLNRLNRRKSWRSIGKSTRNKILKEINYFKNNADRMHYGYYKKMGFPIGSGIIESACKNVFGARFKLGGQRWKKKRIDRLLSLRIQYLNDELTKTLKTLYLKPNTFTIPINSKIPA